MPTIKFPLEIGGIDAAVLNISIRVNPLAMGALQAAGFGEMELANTLQAKAREVVEALDGSVKGLIVTSYENL